MCFISVGSLVMYLLIKFDPFVEAVGFLAVFTEAMLGTPQFYRNYQNKSTFGMRYVMWNVLNKKYDLELNSTGAQNLKIKEWAPALWNSMFKGDILEFYNTQSHSLCADTNWAWLLWISKWPSPPPAPPSPNLEFHSNMSQYVNWDRYLPSW